MPRHLPSTIALQAFESAAFHLSITKAGGELHLTQSAVSRQIQALEEHVGTALFTRQRQRIQLTPAGERYLQHVRKALDELETARLQLRSWRLGGGALELAILPTFGSKWLIPRFPSFAAANPQVQVNFTTRLYPFDFAGTDLDAAVHYGERHWPGAALDHLFDEDVLVVCSKQMARRPKTKDKLAGQTLLQMSARPHGWNEWLAAQDVTGIDGARGPRFENHLMVLQAAIAGLGLALLPECLITDELARGEVVEAFPGSRWSTGKAYWLVYPETKRDLPALVPFRAWLLQVANVERERQTPRA